MPSGAWQETCKQAQASFCVVLSHAWGHVTEKSNECVAANHFRTANQGCQVPIYRKGPPKIQRIAGADQRGFVSAQTHERQRRSAQTTRARERHDDTSQTVKCADRWGSTFEGHESRNAQGIGKSGIAEIARNKSIRLLNNFPHLIQITSLGI